jgi:hypothetical protein
MVPLPCVPETQRAWPFLVLLCVQVWLGSQQPGVGGVVLHSPLLSGVRVFNPNLRWWPSWADIFPNHLLVKKVDVPLLVMHGTADEVGHPDCMFSDAAVFLAPWASSDCTLQGRCLSLESRPALISVEGAVQRCKYPSETALAPKYYISLFRSGWLAHAVAFVAGLRFSPGLSVVAQLGCHRKLQGNHAAQ